MDSRGRSYGGERKRRDTAGVVLSQLCVLRCAVLVERRLQVGVEDPGSGVQGRLHSGEELSGRSL